jgi:hypothetical protein
MGARASHTGMIDSDFNRRAAEAQSRCFFKKRCSHDPRGRERNMVGARPAEKRSPQIANPTPDWVGRCPRSRCHPPPTALPGDSRCSWCTPRCSGLHSRANRSRLSLPNGAASVVNVLGRRRGVAAMRPTVEDALARAQMSEVLLRGSSPRVGARALLRSRPLEWCEHRFLKKNSALRLRGSAVKI